MRNEIKSKKKDSFENPTARQEKEDEKLYNFWGTDISAQRREVGHVPPDLVSLMWRVGWVGSQQAQRGLDVVELYDILRDKLNNDVC